MIEYNVTVSRTEIRSHTFKVMAGSPKEAVGKAKDKACDHDFNQDTVSDVDYEVIELQKAE